MKEEFETKMLAAKKERLTLQKNSMKKTKTVVVAEQDISLRKADQDMGIIAEVPIEKSHIGVQSTCEMQDQEV